MTKEEYAAESKRISDEIGDLKKKASEMEVAYLYEHCPVRGGDKVKIFVEGWNGGIKEHVGYIRDCSVGSNGAIQYSFWKAKKDGSLSSHSLSVWGKNTSVELIEKGGKWQSETN